MPAENPLERVSDKDLLQEAIDRKLVSPDVLGGAAIKGFEIDGEAVVEQEAFGRFIDVEQAVDASEQLTLMGEFWGRLGYEVPELSTDQERIVAEKVSKLPGRRVVPTPLLSLVERKALVESARIFPSANFNADREALRVTGEDSGFSRNLLNTPGSDAVEGGKTYGLRYKTPSGEIVGREAYIAALQEAGQAVAAEDGTIWTFPIVDVGVRSERTDDQVNQLHELVSPLASPESVLVTQLLHQAAGTPNEEWEADLTNEAGYQIDKNGNPKLLICVAGIRWRPDNRRIILDYWPANAKRHVFGVRNTTSALQPA